MENFSAETALARTKPCAPRDPKATLCSDRSRKKNPPAADGVSVAGGRLSFGKHSPMVSSDQYVQPVLGFRLTMAAASLVVTSRLAGSHSIFRPGLLSLIENVPSSMSSVSGPA